MLQAITTFPLLISYLSIAHDFAREKRNEKGLLWINERREKCRIKGERDSQSDWDSELCRGMQVHSLSLV